jgi:hypothetical protein
MDAYLWCRERRASWAGPRSMTGFKYNSVSLLGLHSKKHLDLDETLKKLIWYEFAKSMF